MIKNEPSIKLSEANVLREQKVKARLDNLVHEIDIHSKQLKTLESACAQREKDKDYLDEQVFRLNGTVLDLNNKVGSLYKEISVAQMNLDDIQDKSKKISKNLSEREESVKTRESSVQERELIYEKKSSELREESAKIEEHKATITQISGIFSECKDKIIKSIPW